MSISEYGWAHERRCRLVCGMGSRQRRADSRDESGGSLVVLEAHALRELEPSALAWACIGPVMALARGKPPAVKHELYRTLTPGQKALFSFWALHGHAESAVSFRSMLKYLIEEMGGSSQLQAAAVRFGSSDLACLYRACSTLIAHQSGRDGAPVPSYDAEIQPLYERYWELAPEALTMIADYIRRNPNEFIGPPAPNTRFQTDSALER